MAILVVGLNHNSAPLQIREQLHFSEEEKKLLEIKLTSSFSILECIVLSTCNRTEIYAVTDSPYLAEGIIKNHLLQKAAKHSKTAAKSLYVKVNDGAVTHLFNVVCGLDSLVVGETQILGQVKEAFFQSQKDGCTGTLFNRLFKQAITIGKRAHTITGISKQAVSVSYAAIQLLKQHITRLNQKQTLIIGAGEMSKLAAKHLQSEGCTKLIFANRTFDRVQELAGLFDGSACPLEDSFGLMEKVDIVICSVSKRDYLLQSAGIHDLIAKRKRPLYLIDLGVPRNVDPKIAGFENVHLYDIDHLNGVIESNSRRRLEESHKIKVMIKEELTDFKHWKKTLPVTALIRELQENASRIEREAMRNIENKLPDLTDRDKQIIHKFTKMISNQLIRQPIISMKEIASDEVDQAKKDEYLALASRLLGLESEIALDPDGDHERINEMFKETGS
ncbi:glutamyl-tRNA reductase [Siminovitchia acidinfaciens]|uniref:glutamyl-tRNA reductase n=1 Tax=Siminovitchia acidinfaciens TaxID=2321395 RepID=UPI0013DEFAA9|nr:glutamyl-tRNA reductase [Siminovitchia acidinfaciens]